MTEKLDARACALIAARCASDKKAHDIVVQHVAEKLRETDYFVIATGMNKPQVNAVINDVREKIREATGRSVESVEGAGTGDWVLLDYGDFVVHVMKPEARDFYRLESVWNDAPFIDLAAEGIEVEEYSPAIAGVVAKAGYEE